MTRIELFITTADLFRIIFKVLKNNPDIKLIFQRFESNQYKAGFLTIDATSASTLANQYNEGNFSLAYLSLKGIPTSEQDWSFLDANEEYLTEITGGRQRNNDIEETVIRLLAKNTKCKKVFSQLAKEIDIACSKGVLLNDQLYPKIFYHQNVAGLNMWADLESKTIRAQVPPP